jgi:hypothetical protein
MPAIALGTNFFPSYVGSGSTAASHDLLFPQAAGSSYQNIGVFIDGYRLAAIGDRFLGNMVNNCRSISLNY